MKLIEELKDAVLQGFYYVVKSDRNDDGVCGVARSKEEAIRLAWEEHDNHNGGWWRYGSDYEIQEHWGSPEGFSWETIESCITQLEELIREQEEI